MTSDSDEIWAQFHSAEQRWKFAEVKLSHYIEQNDQFHLREIEKHATHIRDDVVRPSLRVARIERYMGFIPLVRAWAERSREQIRQTRDAILLRFDDRIAPTAALSKAHRAHLNEIAPFLPTPDSSSDLSEGDPAGTDEELAVDSDPSTDPASPSTDAGDSGPDGGSGDSGSGSS